MIQYLRIFVWMEKELKDAKNIWFINVSCASLTDGTYIVVHVLDSLNSGLFILKNAKYFFIENYSIQHKRFANHGPDRRSDTSIWIKIHVYFFVTEKL